VSGALSSRGAPQGTRSLAVLLCAGALLLLARSSPLPALPGPPGGLVAVELLSAQALDQLGTIWYYAYHYEGANAARHHRVFVALPHHDEGRLAATMRAHPGSWWMVGNEPNDPHQDNLSPTAYAAFYHRFARIARREDPMARLMPAGIANADWQWAEAFCTAYREAQGSYPRVDAWNVHNYVLESNYSQLDQQVFRDRLIAFRAWMSRAGEGDKPLVLSEFGILVGQERHDTRYEPPEEIVAYIHETVGWLHETDYVQSWAWFASYTSGLFNGDLYDHTGQLTLYGEAYRDALQAIAEAE
jgi:hypothetical protein